MVRLPYKKFSTMSEAVKIRNAFRIKLQKSRKMCPAIQGLCSTDCCESFIKISICKTRLYKHPSVYFLSGGYCNSPLVHHPEEF